VERRIARVTHGYARVTAASFPRNMHVIKQSQGAAVRYPSGIALQASICARRSCHLVRPVLGARWVG